MTLCTSDTEKYGKTALVYLIISILCAVFGAIYEYFSFGVYSYHMLYAFAYPLIGGALPFLIMCLRGIKIPPWKACEWLYHSGIAAFTVGSIVRGILDIYGTSNSLTQWYWYIGAALISGAAVLFIAKAIFKHT